MKRLLLPLLILVVLTAGCVDLDDFFQGTFRPETTELPPDTMVIKDARVIPTPPVNAQDQFTVYFIIKNQDELREVEDVQLQLYDYGMCELISSSPSLVHSAGTYSTEFDVFVPDQEETVEWIFKAQSGDQMGYLEKTCPIRWKVTYDFTSLSQINVQVISNERLRDLQREGQTPTFTPVQTIGRGPVKIYFNFGTNLPIRTSTETDSILPIYINVTNKGRGIFSEVPEEALKIYVPDDFEVVSCPKFTYDDGAYVNNEPLPLINKKSPQYRCSFKMPTDDTVPVDKTYYINANMTYSYDITGEQEVKVKPTLGL